MIEYHKIQSVFKRDEKTHKFIDGTYSLPEFEYLQDNQWEWTEKIDGTNVRVGFGNGVVSFGGRTDNAQMPTFLLSRLQELFTPQVLEIAFPDYTDVVLFGEGYGAKIQKGGGNYIPNGVDFILFDVNVGEWWLKREDVADVAHKLAIRVVPTIGVGTLSMAVVTVQDGFDSQFGSFLAEGIVLRPCVELQTRSGHRIITKMKHKDF